MSEMECTNEKRGFLQDNDLTIDAAEQYGNGGPQTSERHSRSQDSKVQFQDRPNSRENRVVTEVLIGAEKTAHTAETTIRQDEETVPPGDRSLSRGA
ncbi:hypothetical protein OUZ56_011725 [Daphnia magna]|uniref:Uncharacterized protein n=1 Tax=Daphnia magna TaxID=35525 RepID=A0ABQ9Z0Z6_9CRUS|nr:hypothetical protein OUZ56_011725 [Daphnia magna]